MTHYIPKSDTWFDIGQNVALIVDSRPEINMGIFCGFRTCQNPESEMRLLGEEYLDEELCSFDEFEIING